MVCLNCQNTNDLIIKHFEEVSYSQFCTREITSTNRKFKLKIWFFLAHGAKFLTYLFFENKIMSEIL